MLILRLIIDIKVNFFSSSSLANRQKNSVSIICSLALEYILKCEEVARN